jgi:hypothetical protein
VIVALRASNRDFFFATDHGNEKPGSSALAIVGFRVGCVGFFVGTGLSKAVQAVFVEPVFAICWTVLYCRVPPQDWFLSPLRLPISPSRLATASTFYIIDIAQLRAQLGAIMMYAWRH